MIDVVEDGHPNIIFLHLFWSFLKWYWALIKSESCASVRLGAGLLRKCEFSFDQPSYNGPGALRKHWCCAHEDPWHISPGEAKPGHQNAAQRHVFVLMILTAIWCSSMLLRIYICIHKNYDALIPAPFLVWSGEVLWICSHLEMIKLKPLALVILIWQVFPRWETIGAGHLHSIYPTLR